MNTTAKHQKKNLDKRLEFDIQDLIRVYEKLNKNEVVDQNVVIGVIVRGILDQHDVLAKTEAKLNELETKNNTSKNRIESLETWVNKQDKAIDNIKNSLEKGTDKSEVEILKQKIEGLESFKQNEEKDKIVKKCDLCDKIFSKNCDYENHKIYY